ncbi:hypothetical protein COL52_05760 [Bacillus toyonensis]|uniref:Uncharacterized protein n=1 Tax=Bacillus toyonensis TaxID=155322 RepID=A0A2C5IWX0_9BACI|nr:hypothetical protein CN688_24880 [Bacillus toyonensis]PEK78524.1 hypothetical protein CN594_26325 [Bacillus toyonensis]PEL17659.1 hypothetical protein CN624_29550 [Bacillus toyonensis]PFY44477.1 hypothetical protein COL55_19690 [Bacillus toyonensis]PFY61938.1 hypothetical protein COL62_32175 [Bacillus toyonensis]
MQFKPLVSFKKVNNNLSLKLNFTLAGILPAMKLLSIFVVKLIRFEIYFVVVRIGWRQSLQNMLKTWFLLYLIYFFRKKLW